MIISRMIEVERSRVLRRLGRDRLAVASLVIIALYALVATLVVVGVVANDVDARVGAKFLGPGPGHWLGTDRQGRDILVRTLHATKIAFFVGLLTATLSVLLGTFLGAVAGYFRGPIDAAVVFAYSTIQSVPSILLLLAITYIAGKGIYGVFLALSATYWVSSCRLVRGEVMKVCESEYVQAARTLGYGPWRVLFVHILPNTFHVVLVNFALVFVGAIKAEVILSYLGLGVQGEPSWGTMIDQARAELINGFFWQIGAATTAMFVLVLALNLVSDGLQEALDPRSLKRARSS